MPMNLLDELDRTYTDPAIPAQVRALFDYEPDSCARSQCGAGLVKIG